MIEVFQFYYDLYQYSPVGSEAWMWGEIEMNLAAGMVAMAPYLPSIQIRMNEMDSDDLGFAHLPLFEPGFPQGNLTYPNTVVTFAQTAERGNLPIVEEFMRFIMRPEINVHLTSGMEPGGFIPSTEAAAAYEGYWSNPIIQRFLEVNEVAIETLEFATLYGFEFGRWVNLGIGEIGGANVLSDAMSRVLAGEMTPAEAAQWGADQMEAMSVPVN
jgi:multiple sugar transport system substrate-binding protein